MTIPLGMSLFCSAQESAMLTTPRRVRRTPAASLCCQLLFFYVDVMLYLAYKSLSSNMEGQWRHSGRQKPSRHTDVILVMWRLAFFAGERICCDYHGKEGVCYQRLYSITLSMDPLLLLQRNLFYTIEPYLWSVLLIPLNVRGAVFFEAIYSQKKQARNPLLSVRPTPRMSIKSVQCLRQKPATLNVMCGRNIPKQTSRPW